MTTPFIPFSAQVPAGPVPNMFHARQATRDERSGPISLGTQVDEHGFLENPFLQIDRDNSRDQLLEDLKANLQEDASLKEFCEHIWGLPREEIESILSREWEIDSVMVRRYIRQVPSCTNSSRRPFRAIWSKAQAQAFEYFGTDPKDAKDLFLESDDCSDLASFFADDVPDSVRIWKSSLAQDVPPDWEHVKAFLVFNHKKEQLSTSPPFDLEPEGNAAKSVTPVVDVYEAARAPFNRRRSTKNTGQASFTKILSQSPKVTEDEVRLATYAVECLATQFRRYATGILVNGTKISLYYFDRNLAIRTSVFDLSTTLGTQYLVLVAYALSRCDHTHSGFDPCFKPSGNGIENDAVCLTFPHKATSSTVYELEDCIYSFSGLLGNGLSEYMVKEISHGKFGSRKNLKKVWCSSSSLTEAEIVSALRVCVPELAEFLPDVQDIGCWDAQALGLPWANMTLPYCKLDTELSLQVSLARPPVNLWEVGTIKNFKKVFIDCIEAHFLAWSKGGIIHGSISEQSLGAYRQSPGSPNTFNGIIKNWELGVQDTRHMEIPKAGLHPANAFCFMAAELARSHDRESIPPTHLYRHDLESFFYVIVWACMHYNLEDSHRDSTHPHELLSGWMDLKRSAECKHTFLYDVKAYMMLSTDHMKTEWLWIVRNWVSPLRDMFAHGLSSIPDKDSAEWENYDIATCNGRITHELFMEAIAEPVHNACA